jgi:hypothetical protein
VMSMLLSVHLGSIEVFAIWMARTRVDGEDEDEDDMDETEAYELSVGCRVHERTDGGSCSSTDLAIPVHALCFKSGQDYTQIDRAFSQNCFIVTE